MFKTERILVIGASIAGPALCYWLKKAGFSPVLIDKSKSLRKGGFAIDIRGIAVALAKKMDIYEKVCEQRTKIALGRCVDALGQTRYEEEGERFGFREGEDVEIVRGTLVELLMEKIPDVPCYFDQTVDHFTQHQDFVEVSFKDGRKESFDLVIGADGLHSSTRQEIFNETEYHLKNLGSYICVFDIPNYLNLDHCDVMYEGHQKLIHMNSDEDPDSARAGFMFRSPVQLKDPRDEAEQKQVLKEIFQDSGWEANKLLELMETSKDFYFDSLTQVIMPCWSKGRVALVGDAGYCASPLSGQGTSLALVGAYILAGELRASNGDHEKAFANYNEKLRPFVDANQQFGAWVSSHYLLSEETSEEVVKQRNDEALKRLNAAANSITLPEYL